MDPRTAWFLFSRLVVEVVAALAVGSVIGHLWRSLTRAWPALDPAVATVLAVLLALASLWGLTTGGWHVHRLAEALATWAVTGRWPSPAALDTRNGVDPPATSE